MEIHFKITGCLLIVLAFIHVIFPKYFKWKEELRSLSLINRQMMQVHTLFIAITIFLMGLLCITAPHELSTTPLGKKISMGLSAFWGIRLWIQFFGYSPILWRGKKTETIIHILFIALWTYFTWVFAWNACC